MGRVRIRQLGGKRRTLDLRGRSGCLMPVRIGMKQRGEIKWVPLTDQGIPHQQGGEPKPIEFRFRWFDRFFFGTHAPVLDGKDQTDSQLLLDAVMDMVAEGQIVELQHEHRTYFGVLREADGEMGKEGEQRAFITFEPQQLQPKRAKRPGPDPERAMDKVRRVYGQVLRTARLPATVSQTVIDNLAEGVGAVNTALRRMGSVVNAYRTTRQGLEALGQGFAHACVQLETAALQMGDAVDLGGAAMVGTDDASLWVDAMNLSATVRQGSRAMRQRILQERELARLGNDGRIQTVHYATEGTNLSTLAAYYWGSEKADRWRQIAVFNNLEGRYLAAGQTIVIPYPRPA